MARASMRIDRNGSKTHFALLKTEDVRVSRKSRCLIPAGIHRIDRMLSVVWEGPLVGVRRVIDRKFGRHSRGRETLFDLPDCVLGVVLRSSSYA